MTTTGRRLGDMPFGGAIFWLITTGLFPLIAIGAGLGAVYASRTDRPGLARGLAIVAVLAVVVAVAWYFLLRAFPP